MLVHIFLFYMAFTICKSVYRRRKEYMIVILCCWFAMFQQRLPTKVKFQCLLRRKTAESDLTRSTCTKGLWCTYELWRWPCGENQGQSHIERLHVECLGLADFTSTQQVIAVQIHNNIVYKYILWHWHCLTLRLSGRGQLTCNWTGHWTRDNPYGPWPPPWPLLLWPTKHNILGSVQYLWVSAVWQTGIVNSDHWLMSDPAT